MKRDRSDDLDAWDLLQFADLLHRQLGLAGNQPLGGIKPDGSDLGAGVDLVRRWPMRSINCAKKKIPLAPIRE